MGEERKKEERKKKKRERERRTIGSLAAAFEARGVINAAHGLSLLHLVAVKEGKREVSESVRERYENTVRERVRRTLSWCR